MGTIQRLPRELIEKIAAGEVVERPASVVKELVENAIDAAAAAIAIEISEGGSQRIAVTDDGSGMDAADLGLCVERHATSKIATAADLFAIRTMGFRGEALSAIGAVSRLAILSRPNRADVIEGSRIEVEGGEVRGPVVAGCAGGTRVEVRELFYNVPARQKFLRSAAVEAGHVIDTVATLALSHPAIRFDLTSDSSRKLSLPACAGDAALRVGAVLGERFAGRLIPVEEAGGALAIRGWVAEGGRSGGKDIHFFLNRRPVRDRLLMHALAQAFAGREVSGAGPAAVIWLEIDPAAVDVNVHPAKREVRFAKGGAVHDFVVSAVRKALSQTVVAVSAADRTDGVRRAILQYEERRLATDAAAPKVHAYRADSKQQTLAESVPATATRLRPLGQVGLAYIACEDPDGALVLIDQHAAHERLGFDALCAQHAAGRIAEQRFLIPQRVELDGRGAAAVAERHELLAAAGFEVEPFGGTSIMVKSVPEILSDAAIGPLFEQLAADFEEIGASTGFEQALERIFAVVACHRQVRAGDRLTLAEMEALVTDIEREGVITCPHGRPAVVRIERTEIERWFKRTT